jgi:two-component system sensor histidine kinase KdpD
MRIGLGCRVAAPLLAGSRAIGVISIARVEPASFSPAEVELAGLLGRFVGSAVQNIHAYEAERRTVDELRRLSELRSDFVSMVSHELRSPMSAVLGSARTLYERWDVLTAEQRGTLLGLIADETGRLAGLISDVLDTSRIDAGTFTYTFRDVAVDQIVRDAAAAASAASRDGTVVEARVDGSLPLVRGDADRLRQVLANLIENAVKYSPDGERVVVRAHEDVGRVTVDVEDHGPGIPRDQQSLIFEKFGRAKVEGETTRSGSGLGLYIARSIAEAHDGALNVQSSPGRGATFTLSLPVRD